MGKIKRYRDWAPTGFDCEGLGLDDRQGWIVAPVSRNRDSGAVDESNSEAVERMAAAAGVECEIHRFGHWACGWFEIVLLEPTAAGEALALELAARLEDYPLLDEGDHSDREWGAICAAWVAMGLRDRIEECASAGASIFAARRDEIPAELSDSGRCYAWITQ